jgi:murein DD-endopeptidase MepM/ murein hydrolase activator NlpD
VAGTDYRWDVTACSGASGAGTCITSGNATFSTQAATTVRTFYLSFPLSGHSPYDATITSVFDHSMSGSYAKDNLVVAYTGEIGDKAYGVAPDLSSGYENAGGTNFNINGHYSGGSSDNSLAKYLYYDGHPGYDYSAADGTAVYAVADGTVHYPASLPPISDATSYHTLAIDHGNGYISYYLHLQTHPSANNAVVSEGQSVHRGDPVGYSGHAAPASNPVAPHLHYEIHNNGTPVDPYGWTGSGADPYAIATNVNLWYSLSAYSANLGSGSDAGHFNLTTSSGNRWTANTTDSWIRTSSSGTGSGTVNYTVDANTSTSSRSGTITAGGQTFTITQAGSSGGGGVTLPLSGKGDWIWLIDEAITAIGGSTVQDLIDYEKSKEIQYLIVKAGEGNHSFPDSATLTKLDSTFVQLAKNAGLKVFGYHYVYGGAIDAAGSLGDPPNTANCHNPPNWCDDTDPQAEGNVAIAILATGVDGLVIDAEDEYFDSHPWRIRKDGTQPLPAADAAKKYFQTIRASYPNAFLAHAPYPIPTSPPPSAYYEPGPLYDTPFPYMTFGENTQAVLPQAYYRYNGLTALAMVQQMNSAWITVQNSWVQNGHPNAIKPIFPIGWGNGVCLGTKTTDADITAFVNELNLISPPASAGGYTGVSFWRAECHGPDIWAAISAATLQPLAQVPSDGICLSSGWNFISLRKQPTNTDIVTVLADVLSNVRIVWGYDNQNKVWKKYNPGGTVNSLLTMEVGKGYWIYMNASGCIDMAGWAAPSSTTVHVSEGWNLTGYIGANNTPVVAGLGSIPGKWSFIWNWENGQWSTKSATIFTLPNTIQPLTNLYQDKAYWIKVNGSADWAQ